MCGRYTVTTPVDELIRHLDLDAEEADALRSLAFAPRHNLAPTEEGLIVTAGEDARRWPRRARWGLCPFWAESPTAVGARMINARAETVATNAAFRRAFRERRCLVPADGFYEWKKPAGGEGGRVRAGSRSALRTGPRPRSQPYRIGLRDGAPFCFAGLWETWRSPEGGERLVSYTVITTAPNALVAPLHDRMPAILPAEAYASWLGLEAAGADRLLELLAPFPAERMDAYPVSTLVSTVGNEGPLVSARLARESEAESEHGGKVDGLDAGPGAGGTTTPRGGPPRQLGLFDAGGSA